MTLPIDELIEKLNDWSRANDIFNYERKMFLDAASALTSLQERNRKLEESAEAVRKVIASGYRVIPHKTRKAECAHGRLLIEDCIACYDESLLAALDGQSA